MFPIKCAKCGCLLNSRKSFKLHIVKTHHLTGLDAERFLVYSLFGEENVEKYVNQYKNEELCINDFRTKNLPDICLYIELLGIKRTSSQERHTKRYKEKYLKSIQKKFGSNITNISQASIVQKKKEKTFAKTYGSYKQYLEHAREKMFIESQIMWKDSDRRQQTIKNMKQAIINKYGVDNVTKVPEIIKKLSNSQKKRLSEKSKEELRKITENARKVKTENGSISNLERRIWPLVNTLNVPYRTNKFMFGFSWDLIFDDKKILIEIQGDYYHAWPEKYIATDVLMTGLTAQEVWDKDARKNSIATNAGYVVYYIWEHEMNSMTDESLLKLIKGYINEK